MRLRDLLVAGLLLAVSSCATVQPQAEEQLPSSLVPLISGEYQVVRPDTLGVTKSTKPAGLLASFFGSGRVKNKGTIIIQTGQGNIASANKEEAGKVKVSGSSSYAQDSGTATTATKAGAKGGAAALGPESVATASTTKETGLP